ncbi:MAG TPA: hypothetical protein VER37_05710 [Thermomicrobiales bacterium]|nr:hypothetical protein [Thermomicrobiales bacterium]
MRHAGLGPAVLVVFPDGWPSEDRAAYDAAGATEDAEVHRDVV